MGRKNPVQVSGPASQPTIEHKLDKLALRIREKLYGALEQNVERFIENMDLMLQPQPRAEDPEAVVYRKPRALPQATPKQRQLASGQATGRKCRNCRQPGHRADKCPNPAVDQDGGDSDEDPGGARPARALSKKQIKWAEQLRLIKLVQQTGDRRILNHLVAANMGLVHRVARKCPWHVLPYEDVVQEGAIGLVKGIMRFDTTRGMRLSTYATWWIRHDIYRAHQNGDIIRVPVHAQESLFAISKASKRLEEELGRAPADEEVAEATKLELKKVRMLRVRGRISTSLDQVLLQDGEETLHNILADNAAVRPDDEMDANETKLQIADAIAKLPAREAAVIRMRYLEGDGMTLREVGDLISSEITGKTGVSRERVRQMETAAIKMLRGVARRQRAEIKRCSTR